MVIPANFIYLRKLRQSMLVPKSGFGMLTINILNNRIYLTTVYYKFDFVLHSYKIEIGAYMLC